MIDLTKRWDPFAVYLPSIQFPYAKTVDTDRQRDKSRSFPKGIKLTDLDFLNPKSELWHYGYALYSAGQFESAKPQACAVTNRDKERTVILGDSGGFQIGCGTLKGTEHLKGLKSSQDVCAAWRNDKSIIRWIVNWLDTHSDYAMTIDMPLWAQDPRRSKTPFHQCSTQELIDLTIGNLEYIKANTRGTTKWLNVLQGQDEKSSKLWFDAVKKYKFGGWALGGLVGWRGGLENVLQSTLLIRDEGGFEGTQDWLHVLGVSTPQWAVLLSAIQRGIRAATGNPVRVSYDSATPFQSSGHRQQVIRYPKFTRDAKTWSFQMHEAPVNPVYAAEAHHFPYSSPLGELLDLSHLNIRGGEFQGVPFDSLSYALLTNHNLYVYVRALLEANELAFMRHSEADKAVPSTLLDVCAFVEDIMMDSNWKRRLKKESKLLAQIK